MRFGRISTGYLLFGTGPGGRRRAGAWLEAVALLLIRLFSNRRVARLALRYALSLYPEQPTRRLRFYLRSLIWLPVSAVWFALLDSHPDLRRCRRHEPEMAEKLHRPYRRAGLGPRARLDLLTNHLQAGDRLGWSGFLARAYAQPLALARFSDKAGRLLTLTLARPGQFGKEGELALHLSDGRTRLYSACLSFRVGHGRHELDIGCLQGPDGEEGRQRVRDLTRGLHGMRPRSLMLEGLRAIAGQAGCGRLRVVGNSGHVYRSWRKRRGIAFDYDLFCSESRAAIRDGHDWLLPVAETARPQAEVPSKKRAETARRRDLIAHIANQIVATLERQAANGSPQYPPPVHDRSPAPADSANPPPFALVA